jgi:hypothetical protein
MGGLYCLTKNLGILYKKNKKSIKILKILYCLTNEKNKKKFKKPVDIGYSS